MLLAVLVSCFRLPPFASTRYSWMLPSRLLWNTTHWLSSERLGRESVPGAFEMSTGVPIGLSSRKISRFCSRKLWSRNLAGEVRGGAGGTSKPAGTSGGIGALAGSVAGSHTTRGGWHL